MRGSTTRRLEEMLEDAMNDRFEESDYDETRLSRLEVKWKHFLTSSVASEHKAAEEKQKIKTLIADISHQTKTPLSNILLYSQILQEKETDPELRVLVDNIRNQSEKLNFLISSLVKASRLETEVLVLQPKKQKLAPMLEEVQEAFGEALAAKQMNVTLKAGEEEAFFDRKWTTEAIGNLLDNGIKYSPAGSLIQIRVKQYELFTAVEVEDQGIGIREEEQAQIFGRFYRSREAADEEGVGIGLYLVREIAERQGGYVRVSSRYGRGSCFGFFMKRE